MTKSVSANLKAHLALEVTTLARLWKLTRTDGTVMGFTNHDKDIVYDGVTYEAEAGMFSTALQSTSNLAVDTAEAWSVLDSGKITLADILAKKYDYAVIDIYIINYASVGDGVLILGGGWVLGELKVEDERVIGEVRSKGQKLQQVIGDLYSPECRVDLGSVKCGINLEPSDWIADTIYASGDIVKATSYDGRRYICSVAGTSDSIEPSWDTTIGNTTVDNTVTWTCYDAWMKQGIVTAIDDNRTFYDTTTPTFTEADDWFNYGMLTWITGDNAGYEMEVKDWVLSTKKIILFEVMPYDLEVGDTFKMYAGCDKTLSTCKNKFANVINMRAEPYIPGIDEVMSYAIPG